MPLLIIEEEVVFETEMSIEEVTKLFRGRILMLEGEKCLFIPVDLPQEVLEIIKKNRKFKKWWEGADVWEFKEGEEILRGKIFLIKEI